MNLKGSITRRLTQSGVQLTINMDNTFPHLNIENFAHSYDLFYDSMIHVLKKADSNGTLHYLLPEKIYKQYEFSSYKRSGFGLMLFLESTYISRHNKEGFISLLNSILPKAIILFQRQPYELTGVHKYLQSTVIDFIDLVANTNEEEVFSLDFFYDKKDKVFKRLLDSATIETINQNASNIDSINKERYEECVAEFLSYKREIKPELNLFYNQSLDKLKRIIENTLENSYQKEDGSFPKLSNKKQVSNILFDGLNTEFENNIEYIITNVHHEKGGQPKKFSEKEYVYLWLELNKILYLLNRYKK